MESSSFWLCNVSTVNLKGIFMNVSDLKFSYKGYLFSLNEMVFIPEGSACFINDGEEALRTFTTFYDSMFNENRSNCAKRNSSDFESELATSAMASLATLMQFFTDVEAINISNPDGNPHKDKVAERAINEIIPSYSRSIIREHGQKHYDQLIALWSGKEIVEDEEVEVEGEKEKEKVGAIDIDSETIDALKKVVGKLSEVIKAKLEKENESDADRLRSILLDGVNIGLDTAYCEYDEEDGRIALHCPFLDVTRWFRTKGEKRFKKAIKNNMLFPFFMQTLEVFRDSTKSVTDRIDGSSFNITRPFESTSKNHAHAVSILKILEEQAEESDNLFFEILKLNKQQKQACLEQWELFVKSLAE